MRSAKLDALLSRYYTIIIFLIPALTIFTLFVVLPIGEAAYYSFFRWNGYGAPEKFVGFKNSKLKDDDSPGKMPLTAFSALIIPIEVLLIFETEIELSP